MPGINFTYDMANLVHDRCEVALVFSTMAPLGFGLLGMGQTALEYRRPPAIPTVASASEDLILS